MHNRIKEHLDYDTPDENPDALEFDAFYIVGPEMEDDPSRPEPQESVFIWDKEVLKEHLEDNPDHVCVHVLELYVPAQDTSIFQTSSKVHLN
jgi:hypothetical protein